MVLALLGGYVVVGIVFATAFVVWGARRVDAAAAAAGWGFKLLILPGAVALWPYLAWRWAAHRPTPLERSPHRRAAERSAR